MESIAIAQIRQNTQPDIPGYIAKPGPEGLVYRCHFEQMLDRNLDLWPDSWTRRRGKDEKSGAIFPEHLIFEIMPLPTPKGANLFRMNMRGGAGTVNTPNIPVKLGMTYQTTVYLRTNGIVHDDVFFSVSFYDENNTPAYDRVKKPDGQKPAISRKVRNTGNWVELQIGPIEISDTNVRSARVGIHVIPSARQDLNATVDIASIEMKQAAGIRLSSSNPNNIFQAADFIEVTCDLSGLSPDQNRVIFHLENALGEEISHPVTQSLFDDDPARNAFVAPQKGGEALLRGRAVWRPPIVNPGFYRVRVELNRGESNSLNLILIDPIAVPEKGEFGWTLPETLTVKEIMDYRQLLTQAGISRLKVPVWVDTASSPKAIEATSEICEWFSSRRIEVIGLLSNPPKNVREKIRSDKINIAALFSLEIDEWFPSLEPTLLRLAMLVREWQFGADEDRTISAINQLPERVTAVRDRLNKVGFDVSIGFGWDWVDPLPESFLLEPEKKPRNPIQQVAFDRNSPEIPEEGRSRMNSKEFVNLSNEVALSSEEIPRYLDSTENSNVKRWVVLRPLSKTDYPLLERIGDLVQGMLAAKIHGAEAIFIPEPFNNETGLININEEGIASPGELFLPWRTTAAQLAGKKYIGSIRLPNKSENLVFEGPGGDGVIMIWNSGFDETSSSEETLYLGNEVEITDIWGRTTRPLRDGFRHVVPVGRLPVFVTGIDTKIIRWRQGFSVKNVNISSVIGEKNVNGFQFINPFDEGISGTISIHAPDTWKVDLSNPGLAVGGKESAERAFNITLQRKAVSEPRMLRFDFTLDDGEVFDIYEEIDVGGGQVKMQLMSRFNARTNELEVHQALINDGETPVSYECFLSIPGKPVMTHRVSQLGYGRRDHVYRIANGQRLIGQTLTVTARGRGAGMPPLRFEIQANR